MYKEPVRLFLNTIFMNKIINFLKEAKEELGKVTWLSREKTIKYTGMVIGISLVVAVFLGILDLLFSSVVGKFIV